MKMYIIETKEKKFFVLAKSYNDAIDYVIECSPEVQNDSYEVEEYDEGEVVEYQ